MPHVVHRRVVLGDNYETWPIITHLLPKITAWWRGPRDTFQTAGGSVAAADGDLVGEWLTQNGNVNNLTGAGGVRPTLKLAIQNGRSVIRFDGTDDSLSLPGGVLAPTTNSVTVAAVLKTQAASATARVLLGNNEATPILFLFYGNEGAGHPSLWVRDSSNVGAQAIGTTDIRGAFHQVTWIWDLANKTAHVRVNGALEHSAANASITPASLGNGIFGVGSAFRAGVPAIDYFRDDVAEIIIASEVLTGNALISVERYLKNAWGTP